MSWVSDIWDWGVGSVSNSGDWVDRNLSTDAGSWLDRNVSGDNSWLSNNWRDVLNKGREAFNYFGAANDRSGVRSDMYNMYQNMAAQDQAYNQQYYDWMVQNQQASAAAAAANDAARRKAAAEALAIQKKMLTGLQRQYQPFTDAMQELLPPMKNDYKKFLNTTSVLNQYLTPIAMKSLGQAPEPAYSVNMPESAYSVSMPQAQQSTEFPSLEQLLTRRK